MPGFFEPPGWTPGLEGSFMSDMQFAPGWRDWRRGFIDTMGGEPNLSPGGDYDYRRAWMHGAAPQIDPASGQWHGGSQVDAAPYANPIQLKSENHPTAWKQQFMDRFGQNPDLVGPSATPEMGDYFGTILQDFLLRQKGR